MSTEPVRNKTAVRIHCFAAWVMVFAFCVTARADDEGSPAVESLYDQAKAAEQHGEIALAITKYQQIIRLAPHLAPAYNNLGRLYFNDQKWAEAASVLKRGLELDPNMAPASAMLGMSYFELGENEKAEPLLRLAQHANPSDDKVTLILAHILINLKEYKDAAVTLNAYLERNPRDQQGWYMLGKTYLQLSQMSLKQINAIDPDSVVAHEIAGEIDESMHNYDVALVEYKKAVDLAPRTPGTHMHMASAFWSIGKWESAEAEFKEELVNDPNNCLAHWKLGNSILEANGSNRDALSELDQSIERCPGLMQARVDRARALIRLGREREALHDLLMAGEESPSEPTIHFLLATVYRSQGNLADAQKQMLTYAQLQRAAREAVAGQANDANAIKSAAR